MLVDISGVEVSSGLCNTCSFPQGCAIFEVFLQRCAIFSHPTSRCRPRCRHDSRRHPCLLRPSPRCVSRACVVRNVFAPGIRLVIAAEEAVLFLWFFVEESHKLEVLLMWQRYENILKTSRIIIINSFVGLLKKVYSSRCKRRGIVYTHSNKLRTES